MARKKLKVKKPKRVKKEKIRHMFRADRVETKKLEGWKVVASLQDLAKKDKHRRAEGIKVFDNDDLVLMEK